MHFSGPENKLHPRHSALHLFLKISKKAPWRQTDVDDGVVWGEKRKSARLKHSNYRLMSSTKITNHPFKMAHYIARLRTKCRGVNLAVIYFLFICIVAGCTRTAKPTTDRTRSICWVAVITGYQNLCFFSRLLNVCVLGCQHCRDLT